MSVSRQQVLAKLQGSELALSLREINPDPSPIAIRNTAALLDQLVAEGLLRFHRHTDRWSLVPRGKPS